MKQFSDFIEAVYKGQQLEDAKKATLAQVEDILRTVADVVANLKEGEAVRLVKHNGEFVGKFIIGTLAARKGTAQGKAWSAPERKALKFKRNK